MEQFTAQLIGDRLVVHGELHTGTSSQLLAALAGVRDERIDVDLAGLSSIDAAGVRTLVTVHRGHPRVRFSNATAEMQRFFTSLRVGDELLAG